jgi:CDP-glucose 4,6-dehydratase
LETVGVGLRAGVPFGGIYEGRRVLVTGHTGFKGSWLSLWLQRLGATVAGLALPAATRPAHWDLLGLSIEEHIVDVCDATAVRDAVSRFSPEVVFHLAAQPLVRRSYREPATTFATNVLGLVHLLEAVRATPGVRATVIATSDKCYENRNTPRGYREGDPLGGHDPYSASKACAELAAASYRASFLSRETRHGRPVGLATARAGNVVGGGDWSEDRLIPDLVRAAAAGTAMQARNPQATRPWQHVLESLSGYLLLGQRLLGDPETFSEAWNFGPLPADHLSVGQVIEIFARHWPGAHAAVDRRDQPHEAQLLHLDSAKARESLGWTPVWNGPDAIAMTARWHHHLRRTGRVRSDRDIEQYLADARRAGLAWAGAPAATVALPA